ncbi:pseudouridine synthase [Piscinibacter sakaiensis]|uniref:pseudouridine synthase n=1 Tax=Piscinibacter sakaiensis TaxID=1547922 RepID=UPI003AAC4F30
MREHPPIRLLYQDNRLIAVDKPPGLLVHRTALDAHETDDLMTRLRAELPDEPLWPVHRLDKGTSGLLLLARDADAARQLGLAFAAAACSKRYLALVRGWPAEQGSIDRPLARDPELPSSGQPQLPSRTDWLRLQCLEWPLQTHPGHATTRLAMLAVMPHTGRRHQIRRHLKALAHPLIGDSTHGKGPLNRAVAEFVGHMRLWLHAQQLTLPHPDDGRPLTLSCPPGLEWAALPGVDASCWALPAQIGR